MPTFACYVESGPMRRKTMVHVPALLGCVAVGPTTEEALAATPAAIRTFRAFLREHDLPDPAAEGAGAPADDRVEIEVVEHVTEGEWLGNGSPTLVIAPDLEPIGDAEVAMLLRRFVAITEALAAWAEMQPAGLLDAKPDAGRTERAILLHVIAPTGGYLSAALGGASGFSAVASAAEKGKLPIPEALRRIPPLAEARIAESTPEQRSAVRVRETSRGPERRTLRKALRRMLEHEWEHLSELSRRPGGPALPTG